MAGPAPLPMRRPLFQDRSLTGQPRDRSRSLSEILRDEGVRIGARVGVMGWKSFADRSWLEVPAYLADALRDGVGRDGRVGNANDNLIDAGGGLPELPGGLRRRGRERAAGGDTRLRGATRCALLRGRRRMVRGFARGSDG